MLLLWIIIYIKICVTFISVQVFVVQLWWLRYSWVVIPLQPIQVRLNVVILDYVLSVSPTLCRQPCGVPGSHRLCDGLQQFHWDCKDWAVERASRRNNSYTESMLMHLMWIASPMQPAYLVFLIVIFHSPAETNEQHNLNSSEKQGTSRHDQISLMITNLYPNHMEGLLFTLAFSWQGKGFRIRTSHSHCVQQRTDLELFSLDGVGVTFFLSRWMIPLGKMMFWRSRWNYDRLVIEATNVWILPYLYIRAYGCSHFKFWVIG